jgi:hypothetical protein
MPQLPCSKHNERRRDGRCAQCHREAVRRHKLKSRFGLTPAEYDARIAFQHGRCAICHDPMTNPHLDHDHATGQLREVLCLNCNTGIGKLKDNPALLRAAARYIEKHRNQPAPGTAAARPADTRKRQSRQPGA